MKFSTNRNDKIEISVGAVGYLVGELEQKRLQVEKLSIETRVMNNFFGLVNGLKNHRMSCGEGPDRFYEARKEFEAAVYELENPPGKTGNKD